MANPDPRRGDEPDAPDAVSQPGEQRSEPADDAHSFPSDDPTVPQPDDEQPVRSATMPDDGDTRS